MAYHIFELRHVTATDGSQLPLRAFHNGGSQRLPVKGSMLIWDRSYDNTGHVAIVTEATESYVRVVEQNFDDVRWPDGQDYARELRVTADADGRYTVHDGFKILGWMTQCDE